MMMLLLLLLALFPSISVLASSAPVSQNPDSTNVTVKDTFDVAEAKILIVYPRGKCRSFEPGRPGEQNRGGSFVSIAFDLEYDKVALNEILFHSLQSCSAFAILVEKATAEYGDEGEGFPKNWFSPEEFVKQKFAFQNNDSLPGYDLINIGGMNYFYSCGYYEPSGVYSIQAMTFMDDIRIMVHMSASYLYNCDKVYDECKNLLSKIELIPYPPGKNDKR